MRQLISRAALLIVIAPLLVACGVPLDETAQVIPTSELDPDLIRPEVAEAVLTPVDESPGLSVVVHLVNSSGKLEPVSREAQATPEAVLAALLEGPTEGERERGLTSTLSDVKVLTVSESTISTGAVDSKLVSVRLSEDSLALSVRNEQLTAFGQMVYTLTALPDVGLVAFSRQGNQGSVLTDEGTIDLGTAVSRQNFASLSPSPVVGFADPTDVVPAKVSLYFVNEENLLEPVGRTTNTAPDRLLRDLFDGPSVVETRSGLMTITSGRAQALSITIDTENLIALIDLAAGSIPGQDEPELRGLALAQIVYTITELAIVDVVVISIDGVTQGQGQRLSRETFRDLLAFEP